MADRECVSRFPAFRALGEAGHTGRLDDFLMNAMRFLNENQETHEELSNDCHSAMSLASDIFGQEAFRKPNRKDYGTGKSPVNKALLESLSVALVETPAERRGKLRERKDDLVRKLAQLPGKKKEFFRSISEGTQTTRQVSVLFERMRSMVREALS